MENRLAFTFHRRRRIDFNQPNFQVLVHHKIISIKLKTIFTIINHILYTFRWSIYLIFDLFLNHFFENIFRIWKLMLKILLYKWRKVITRPNIIKINLSIFFRIRSRYFFFIIFCLLLLQILLDYTIICEMWKSWFRIGIIILSCHSDIALIIHPNCQGIPVSNKNPLSYVKLFLIYY